MTTKTICLDREVTRRGFTLLTFRFNRRRSKCRRSWVTSHSEEETTVRENKAEEVVVEGKQIQMNELLK